MKAKNPNKGFSLIELMIVVAIIGIVAAFAYPAYGQYVTKARRADGHLGMLNAAQTLERCKATNYTYVGCTLPDGGASPESHYTLALSDVGATTFTITATPIGIQANDTDCDEMTFDHLGVKSPADCW